MPRQVHRRCNSGREAQDRAIKETVIKIVPYHYVRDLSASRYPKINGLSVEDFQNLLEHPAYRHTFTSWTISSWPSRQDGPCPMSGAADLRRWIHRLTYSRIAEPGSKGNSGCFLTGISRKPQSQGTDARGGGRLRYPGTLVLAWSRSRIVRDFNRYTRSRESLSKKRPLPHEHDPMDFLRLLI